MKCAVHAEAEATHAIGDKAACASCTDAANARARMFGETLPVLTAIAYLLALLVAFVALKGRPVVGGLAAVAALFVGRTLQVTLLPVVTELEGPRE